jgi:uncharacterized membrane protein YphA (DoxX/SURF4 family)
MIESSFSVAVGMFFIRIVLGILFFFQGYDKVFRIKTEGILDTFSDLMAQRNISKQRVKPFVMLSSYLEMVGGGFLIVGLFREYTLYLLSLNMLLVAIGFSLLKPMWDMGHYFPRLILLLALLILPSTWDWFCADMLFR